METLGIQTANVAREVFDARTPFERVDAALRFGAALFGWAELSAPPDEACPETPQAPARKEPHDHAPL